MAIPYIPRTILEKYFDNYVKSQHQHVPHKYALRDMITNILDMEEDVSRIMRFDIYMSYSYYMPYWELFHDFIVYVRLQQLTS
jgi:hypothetical protein